MLGRMTIKEDTWHFKVFKYANRVWNTFWDNRWAIERGLNDSNLCYYIRVIVVWLPMLFMVHILVYAFALFVALLLPVILFGGPGAALWFYLGAIIVALVLAGGFVLITYIKEWAEDRPVIRRDPGFLELIAQSFKDVHHNYICRSIESAKERSTLSAPPNDKEAIKCITLILLFLILTSLLRFNIFQFSFWTINTKMSYYFYWFKSKTQHWLILWYITHMNNTKHTFDIVFLTRLNHKCHQQFGYSSASECWQYRNII